MSFCRLHSLGRFPFCGQAGQVSREFFTGAGRRDSPSGTACGPACERPPGRPGRHRGRPGETGKAAAKAASDPGERGYSRFSRPAVTSPPAWSYPPWSGRPEWADTGPDGRIPWQAAPLRTTGTGWSPRRRWRSPGRSPGGAGAPFPECRR